MVKILLLKLEIDNSAKNWSSVSCSIYYTQSLFKEQVPQSVNKWYLSLKVKKEVNSEW